VVDDAANFVQQDTHGAGLREHGVHPGVGLRPLLLATARDDRDVSGAGVGTQLADHRQAAHAGHREVRDDKGRLTLKRLPEPVLAIDGTLHGEPFQLERDLVHLPAVAVVLDDNALRTVPPDYKAVLGEQRIRVYGDLAINTGSYTFFGPARNAEGEPASRPARFSFYRHRDGRPQLVTGETTSGPAGSAHSVLGATLGKNAVAGGAACSVCG
jgi:hypothetical protein